MRAASPLVVRVVAIMLGVLAVVLTVGTIVTALGDVSTTWDVWYYHLPFAARIWRIVPEEAFAFSHVNQQRFEGFPLLGELLQGFFWVILRRPEAANLVAVTSVALHGLFLKRFFRVPLRLSLVATMAIPLVHTHATACYVDLPANVGASVLVLSAFRLLTDGVRDPGLLPCLLLGAAVAANMRFQLNPLVAVVLLAITPGTARSLLAELRDGTRFGTKPKIAGVLAALPLVFATPLKNALVHGNPVYPVKLSLLGTTLPYAEDTYAYAPPSLADASQPKRFFYSLLEVGVRPLGDSSRWTIDQWMPPDSDGCRMGGYFGAYVVVHLAVLAWLVMRRLPRARRFALLFGALTVATSVMPQSHELRYYLYWMLVLVSLNLALVCGDTGGSQSARAIALAVASALALGVVVAVTRGAYLYPSGSSFRTLLEKKVSGAVFERIGEGDRVCLAREPWTILYASTFHSPLRYSVKEAETSRECGDFRWIE